MNYQTEKAKRSKRHKVTSTHSRIDLGCILLHHISPSPLDKAIQTSLSGYTDTVRVSRSCGHPHHLHSERDTPTVHVKEEGWIFLSSLGIFPSHQVDHWSNIRSDQRYALCQHHHLTQQQTSASSGTVQNVKRPPVTTSATKLDTSAIFGVDRRGLVVSQLSSYHVKFDTDFMYSGVQQRYRWMYFG